jgi:putative ABC transport system substrate-binding protein
LPYIAPLQRGLRDLGWVEGTTIAYELRWAEGRADRLAGLVADLVRVDVDVIVAANTAIALAAKQATSRIPIVMAIGGDPVALGLARRVAVLSNPTNPAHGPAVEHLRGVAPSVGVQLQLLEARGPDEFERAFAAMDRERAEALLVVADSMFGFNRARLQGLVSRSRLPAMYGAREHTEAGGLMSYAVDVRDNFRRAAAYVDKILKGARPADLPVEQPTKFELLINLKAAKTLGLVIPPPVLARADRLIE